MQIPQTDDLGRPLPAVNTDHVHVYTSNLQLSLGPSEFDNTYNSAADGDCFATIDPPLSPGPPLRGYAAAPLRPRAPSPSMTTKEERREVEARERDEQYQQMMHSILERTRQHNQAQEQDEDRRLERLLKHIALEQEFVDQLDLKLAMRDRAQYRRQAQLYKEWKEKVYDTIQAQINQQLAQLHTEDISARRRQLMEDYIRVSNQKRHGLYRDIIIESEYDPLVAHHKLLKYTMSDQLDPLKLEVNNAEIGKPKRELGRATLRATMWDRLHSTPYGRFDRMVPPPTEPNALVSRVNFEHFNIARDPDTLVREFPRGKRIQCDGQQRDPRRSTIFEPWKSAV